MVHSAASDHAAEALETLASIMQAEDAAPAARIAAAKAILDRAWGRPGLEEKTVPGAYLESLSDAELEEIIRKLNAAVSEAMEA